MISRGVHAFVGVVLVGTLLLSLLVACGQAEKPTVVSAVPTADTPAATSIAVALKPSTQSPTAIPTGTAAKPPRQTPMATISGRIAFCAAYRDEEEAIYTMNADGSGLTRLTEPLTARCKPIWSPDGTRIAFVNGRKGDVYVINADGTGQAQLTSNPGPDASPAWSPDGTRIAFDSTRDGNRDIYIMNADGSGQTNLTNNSPLSDLSPAWSPDGARIAFISGSKGNWDIYTMKVDGGRQTNLTNNSGWWSSPPQLPAWSPDGTRIAFLFGYVYVMNADGSGQANLTDLGVWSLDSHPAWSPDGTRIAFDHEEAADTLRIYVVNADGSDLRPLPSAPGGDCDSDWAMRDWSYHPTWSPDGTFIAFVSLRDCAADVDIYVMNADGSGQPKLTSYNPGWLTVSHPAWSP